MKLSKDGRAALIKREGKRNKAYLDTVGIPTIGVGHTGPEVYIGLAWTDQQIEDAFTDDVKRFEDAVNKYVTVPLTQNQFDALVSLAFNIGVGAFSRSSVVKVLNLGLYDMAAAGILSWDKQKELKGRRQQEYEQFLKA